MGDLPPSAATMRLAVSCSPLARSSLASPGPKCWPETAAPVTSVRQGDCPTSFRRPPSKTWFSTMQAVERCPSFTSPNCSSTGSPSVTTISRMSWVCWAMCCHTPSTSNIRLALLVSAEARASLELATLWKGSTPSTMATERGRLVLWPPKASPAAKPFSAAPTITTSNRLLIR